MIGESGMGEGGRASWQWARSAVRRRRGGRGTHAKQTRQTARQHINATPTQTRNCGQRAVKPGGDLVPRHHAVELGRRRPRRDARPAGAAHPAQRHRQLVAQRLHGGGVQLCRPRGACLRVPLLLMMTMMMLCGAAAGGAVCRCRDEERTATALCLATPPLLSSPVCA